MACRCTPLPGYPCPHVSEGTDMSAHTPAPANPADGDTFGCEHCGIEFVFVGEWVEAT